MYSMFRKKRHLVLQSNFGSIKDILTIFGARITKTALNMISKEIAPRLIFWLN